MNPMTPMPTFSRWMDRLFQSQPQAPALAVAAPAPRACVTPADRDAGPTCGWFDSSHDLGQGLLVQELSSPESLAAAVPLSQWLDWQLADRRSGARH
jgi:hypothetical protein